MRIQKMAKQIPEGPKGAGLRALKAKAPAVVQRMGFARGGRVQAMNPVDTGMMCPRKQEASKGMK
jgi:hypothetical protein